MANKKSKAYLLLFVLAFEKTNNLFAQQSKVSCTKHIRAHNLLSDDLYLRLGLDKNASQNDIKKAFRFLVTIVHGDTGYQTPGEDPSLEHKNLNEAYETLNNLEKRLRYDLLNPLSGLKRSPTPKRNTDTSSKRESTQKEPSEEKNRKILEQFPFENPSVNRAVRKSFENFSRMVEESEDPFEAIVFSLKWHNRETTGLKGLEARPPIQEGEREALKSIVRKYLPKLLEKNSPYELDVLSQELQTIDPELSDALRVF